MVAARNIEIRIAVRSNEYFSNKLILEGNILQCFKNARDTDQYFCYLDILCSIFK